MRWRGGKGSEVAGRKKSLAQWFNRRENVIYSESLKMGKLQGDKLRKSLVTLAP